jgi:hypothetical protein
MLGNIEFKMLHLNTKPQFAFCPTMPNNNDDYNRVKKSYIKYETTVASLFNNND